MRVWMPIWIPWPIPTKLHMTVSCATVTKSRSAGPTRNGSTPGGSNRNWNLIANSVMSSGYTIVCRTCGSYRMEETAKPELTLKPKLPLQYQVTYRLHCGSCGDEFEVKDIEEYTK